MFKRHKYQWLLGGLIILVAFAVGSAIYSTQKQAGTSKVSETTIAQRYQSWQKAYLVKTAKNQQFVRTTSQGKVQTLSEAQGYGMLITVMAAKQGQSTHKAFDQLTRYYLAHRISATKPLMAWRQTQQNGQMTSTTAEQTSATDGDLDIAYALILADEQWQSTGSLNYGRLATKLLAAIKDHELNSTTKLPLVGDWATAGATRNLVRPSDLITAYFRKFASYTGDGSWTKVAQNSQSTLQKLSGQTSTGLMADFVTVTGTTLKTGTVTANQVSSSHDAQYGFNACRIPWRVAYDYQLSKSKTSQQMVQKMLRFFVKQSKVTAVYTLAGKPVEKYQNQAFTAPIAYASQVLSNQVMTQRYVPLLTAKIPQHDYYPATVQMLMLVMSGALGKQA